MHTLRALGMICEWCSGTGADPDSIIMHDDCLYCSGSGRATCDCGTNEDIVMDDEGDTICTDCLFERESR